jgi:cell division protein FtsW
MAPARHDPATRCCRAGGAASTAGASRRWSRFVRSACFWALPPRPAGRAQRPRPVLLCDEAGRLCHRVALHHAGLASMLSPRMMRRLAVLGFLAALGRADAPAGLRHRFRQGRGALVLAGFRRGAAVGIPQAAFIVFFRLADVGLGRDRRPARQAMSLVAPRWWWRACCLQPDFGQAVLIVFGWSVMYFVAGAPMLLLLGVGAAALGAGAMAYPVRAFRPPDRRLPGRDGRSQHASLALPPTPSARAAISARGVGEGQVKWSLPDAHTDFIIAVAAEEYGLMLVLADHRCCSARSPCGPSCG